MKEKNMICILCPIGCNMQVAEKDNDSDELSVRGIQCKKGKAYAYEEYKNPTRTLTTTVAIKNAYLPRLPVRTNKPLPKEMVYQAMDEINKIELVAPVTLGEIVIKNLLGTKIDVIATRSLREFLDFV